MEVFVEHLTQLPFQYGVSRLGIDCGGVLCISDTDSETRHEQQREKALVKSVPEAEGHEAHVCDDKEHEEHEHQVTRQSLGESMQRHPLSDQCASTVAALVRKFGPENVFIVSKCGPLTQQATVVWLHRWDFFQRTGLLPENVCFCVNRTGFEGMANVLKWCQVAPPDGKHLERLCMAKGCPELTEEQVRGFFGGPQFVLAAQPYPNMAGNVGKGAIASELKLTHFIDDRIECLHSVFFEGLLATPGLGGFESAPDRMAMVCFGLSAESLKANASQDAALQALTSKPYVKAKQGSKRKAIPHSAQELWDIMTESQREAWLKFHEMRKDAPPNPRRKPSPEELELLKRHKAEEKAFKDDVGEASWTTFVAYEKALANPQEQSCAAMRPENAMSEDIDKPALIDDESRSRAKWTCPDAELLWNHRVAVHHACRDWEEVASLFALDTGGRCAQ